MAGKLRRLFALRSRPAADEPESTTVTPTPDTDGHWLDRMLANAMACAVWRERLADRPGAECLEFLLACRCFEVASNGLQRLHLLHSMVHRFIRIGAERPIPLSGPARRRVLAEWAAWTNKARLPMEAKLPGLAAAVAEIRSVVEKEGALGLGT